MASNYEKHKIVVHIHLKEITLSDYSSGTITFNVKKGINLNSKMAGQGIMMIFRGNI